MKYFEKYFSDVDFSTPSDKGEVKVLCPFHQDSDPSASVNVNRNLFKCWVCDSGYNEAEFMSKKENISISQATKMLAEMEANDFDYTDWQLLYESEMWADTSFLEHTKNSLRISDETIKDLHLGKAYKKDKELLAIPVFINGSLMDTRNYNIKRHKGIPKLLGDKGAKSGYIIPFDLWKDDKSPTFLFEGEKDMIVARNQGLNAICLTGGASAYPNEYMLPQFKDREIIIVYDNDNAGREGAKNLAKHLKGVAKSVKYIDIAPLVPEDKGDFADYINLKGGDIFEFLIQEHHEFKEEEVVKKYTTINKALANDIFARKLLAKVSVSAEFPSTYSVPTLATATKEESDDKSTMDAGESVVWTLEDRNLQQMLSLMEVDAKTINIMSELKRFMKIDSKEKFISIKLGESKVVYKTLIADQENDGNATVIELYSFDKMDMGKSYEIEYKIFPHPNRHQKLIAIALSVEEIGEVGDFITDKALLDEHRGSTDMSVDLRVKRLYESTKHYVAPHMDFNIWFLTDLTFHSILDFDYGGMMRGALDVFILGDTQVGKSETTSKLVELYDYGHFLSLKTSTEVGLIGGSAKHNGDWVNTIGAIPRQHRKLAILEEFSGAPQGFIKKMTDIRSSNEIRITRAQGELVAPCKLRMITISNPINDENGMPRNLNTFPNGVIPIMELVKSAEDVTRYDGFLLAPKPETRLNPFSNKNKLTGTPISREAYIHKMEWVYTRLPENVQFAEDVEGYIWEKAEYLNSLFESNVPIFGTTTSKKLARFSVALASLITNTDKTGENIIVTKEVVDYITNWLEEIYSNKHFKLDSVKEEWESYSSYTTAQLRELEELYAENNTLIDHLSTTSDTTQGNLKSVSGLNNDAYNIVFQALTRIKAVRISGNRIYPTEKFRKMYEVMDKTKSKPLNKHVETNAKVDLSR